MVWDGLIPHITELTAKAEAIQESARMNRSDKMHWWIQMTVQWLRSIKISVHFLNASLAVKYIKIIIEKPRSDGVGVPWVKNKQTRITLSTRGTGQEYTHCGHGSEGRETQPVNNGIGVRGGGGLQPPGIVQITIFGPPPKKKGNIRAKPLDFRASNGKTYSGKRLQPPEQNSSRTPPIWTVTRLTNLGVTSTNTHLESIA